MLRTGLLPILTALLLLALPPVPVGAAPTTTPSPTVPRPLMRDFMGLNVHTVQLKPELYAPVCRRVRDYHPMDWDFGDDTSRATTFPMAANRVDWGQLYGSWGKAGYDIDVCAMFDGIPPQKWKDSARDARAYGEAFARYFGPGAARGGAYKKDAAGLVSSVEVGNEPAKYDEKQYRTIFENMARGLRAGDPKLKIATCAVMTGKTDQWSKPLSAVEGLEDLYDVLNVHSYPFKDKWPTWRRSYPEDPSIDFLKVIADVARWRDAHAPGKQVWLTEFGYDSASKPPKADGPWKQWVGVTDEQQARYIVRAFLVLSAGDLDRAYLYFFNDKDEPQLHGASGITRDFKPKPSFYAAAHLYRSLGDFRFVRAVAREEGELYCFEYEKAGDDKGEDDKGGGGGKGRERVFVAWSPTGSGKSSKKVLPVTGAYRAERMATDAAQPARVEWKAVPGGVEVEVTESPVYLWVR